jgi:hypothetical protein
MFTWKPRLFTSRRPLNVEFVTPSKTRVCVAQGPPPAGPIISPSRRSRKEKGASLFRFIYRRLGLGIAAALAVEGAGAGDEEVVQAAERDPGVVREVAAAAGVRARLEHAIDHHDGRDAVRARPLELHGAGGEGALGEQERRVAGGGAARGAPRGQESLLAEQ